MRNLLKPVSVGTVFKLLSIEAVMYYDSRTVAQKRPSTCRVGTNDCHQGGCPLLQYSCPRNVEFSRCCVLVFFPQVFSTHIVPVLAVLLSPFHVREKCYTAHNETMIDSRLNS